MEMEGRGLSGLYRNPSEDLFLKSFFESSTPAPVPATDMMVFKNLSQNFRTDSEELFKSWLTNGENNCYSSPSLTHRIRQGSRRISAELVSLSSQQHVCIIQTKRSNDNVCPQNDTFADDLSNNFNDNSIRNEVERGLPASELFLAKTWFNSSQSMTRSRSSELRRRYVAMQSAQTTIDLEPLHSASGNGINTMKQDYEYSNGFNNVCNTSNQLDTIMSLSNSPSCTFTTPPMSEIDRVSSLVCMLKGTLECKMLSNQIEKQVLAGSTNEIFHAQEVVLDTTFNQGNRNEIHVMPIIFQEVRPMQIKENEIIQTVEVSTDFELEDFSNPTNPIQLSRVSQEPSQSGSSAAATAVSSGFDACDGPSNSGQTPNVCESSMKPNRISDNTSRAKDIREQIMDNLKVVRKRGNLDRNGSVTSAVSVDKEDATKKRRVERSRKMAEAKGRNLVPAIPSDMQTVLKRCENLEKEVRSLKLNLSFMNRKDSEQTKEIEELQNQSEELQEEKECLIEEIKRIMSETGSI